MTGAVLTALSTAQESIWLEHLINPGTLNGGMFSVTIRGALGADLIRAACVAVCDHNPQLRGVVVASPTPVFAIHRVERHFAFERTDLPAEPGTETQAARQWYAQNNGGWDLTRRSPIRFGLLEHASDRRTLVVGVHHIAFDGRSKFVFARQFTRFLTALRSGQVLPPAGPLEVPRAGDHPASAVAYWTAKGLARLPAPLLPEPEYPDPETSVASTDRFDLAPAAAQRLRELARAEEVSYFAVLVAGVAAQLHAYGNEHAVIGIPVDTSTPETRDWIGLQVDVVPVALFMPRHMTFRGLVTEAGAALHHVYRHRRVPFGAVLRELRTRLGADVGRGLFDRVGISYPTLPNDVGSIAGLDVEWDFFAPNTTASFDITVQFRRRGGGETFGRVDYVRAVLDTEDANDLAHGVLQTLESASLDPDQALRTRNSALSAEAMGQPPVGRAVSFRDLACARSQQMGGRPLLLPYPQFLPTSELADAVRAGVRIILDVTDPWEGHLGTVEWHPDREVAAPLRHELMGQVFEIRGVDDRPLPVGVLGALAVVGHDQPTRFRAYIDRTGAVHLVGLSDLHVPWMGRTLSVRSAEARIAAVEGVREVAVNLHLGEGRGGRASVLLVPVPGRERRNWLRAVRRVWPAGWPPLSGTSIVDQLPRTIAGDVDRAAIRVLRERLGTSS